MKRTYSLAAIAAIAFAGASWAGQEGRGVPGVDVNVDTQMPLADTNSDGKISRDEAASNPELAKSFSKYDANKDGSLDKAEFAKFEAQSKKTGDERPNKGNTPGTTDDSTPGNRDLPGPGR